NYRSLKRELNSENVIRFLRGMSTFRGDSSNDYQISSSSERARVAAKPCQRMGTDDPIRLSADRNYRSSRFSNDDRIRQRRTKIRAHLLTIRRSLFAKRTELGVVQRIVGWSFCVLKSRATLAAVLGGEESGSEIWELRTDRESPPRSRDTGEYWRKRRDRKRARGKGAGAVDSRANKGYDHRPKVVGESELAEVVWTTWCWHRTC
ncbi:hypothetical protein F5879DRAFT_926128, partial [Lentinula edodes]